MIALLVCDLVVLCVMGFGYLCFIGYGNLSTLVGGCYAGCWIIVTGLCCFISNLLLWVSVVRYDYPVWGSYGYVVLIVGFGVVL